MVDFIGVGDDNEVVLTFGLPAFELAGKGCDVEVGCVAPRLVEERLHVKLILVGNAITCSELLDHRHCGMILVPNIVFR